MITPFEVYLVMQLDRVVLMSFLIGFPLVVSGSLVGAYGIDEKVRLQQWLGGGLLSCGLFLFLLGTLLPSTKTAAAMIVLPALTSDEVVEPLGNEARELYDLAKQALKKAVDAPVTNEQKVEKTGE